MKTITDLQEIASRMTTQILGLTDSRLATDSQIFLIPRSSEFILQVDQDFRLSCN